MKRTHKNKDVDEKHARRREVGQDEDENTDVDGLETAERLYGAFTGLDTDDHQTDGLE